VAKTIGAVLDALARRFPPDKAAGWDPVGLQFGDAAAPVRTVAVCHEVTQAVSALVEADPPDLVVAYHPLLFRPTTRLVEGIDAPGRAFRLIRAGVAVAVVHTAFDVARGGAADALAEAVGLEEPVAFGPVWGSESHKIVTFVPPGAVDDVAGAMGSAGAGVVGNYRHCSFRVAGEGAFFAGEGTTPTLGDPGANRETEVRLEMAVSADRLDAAVAALVAAHPYEEPAYDVYARRAEAGMVGRIGTVSPVSLERFAERVAEGLGGVVRRAGDPNGQVSRIAVVPGSGGEFLEQAAAAGADAVVTGDVSHHRARAALDRGMAIVDPGHAATERPGVERLYAAVGEIVPDVRDLGVDEPWSSV
jgi:dinuclear metal center YbgI/SA1388 family protein